MGRCRRPRMTEDALWALSDYAETAYNCADRIWHDAWDVKDYLGKKVFDKIQKNAEEIICLTAKHLPE